MSEIYAATADERRLATDWHGGQGSMFYAVSSTGGLSRGAEGFRGGRTDEEWSADLIDRLARELAETAREIATYPEPYPDREDDAETVREWAAKVDALADDCNVVGHLWSDRANGYGWYLCERGICRAKSADGAKGEDGEVDA